MSRVNELTSNESRVNWLSEESLEVRERDVVAWLLEEVETLQGREGLLRVELTDVNTELTDIRAVLTDVREDMAHMTQEADLSQKRLQTEVDMAQRQLRSYISSKPNPVT